MAKLVASMPGGQASPEGPADIVHGPLHLFTYQAPAGRKCQIALELLRGAYGEAVSWTWERVPLPQKVQKSSWYTAINPDGRIPLLVDCSIVDPATGKPAYLSESAAILTHLFRNYDQEHRRNGFTFDTAFENHEVLQWLFFNNATLAPAQAKANGFCIMRSNGDINRAGLDMFIGDTHRAYSILEQRLRGSSVGIQREFIVGNGTGKLSAVDIDLIPWIYIHAKFGIMTEHEFDSNYPHLRLWLDRCLAIEGVRRGIEGYDE